MFLSQTAENITLFKEKGQFCYWNARTSLNYWLFLAKQVVCNNSVYLQTNFKIFKALRVQSLDDISMLLLYLILLNRELKICTKNVGGSVLMWIEKNENEIEKSYKGSSISKCLIITVCPKNTR